MCSCADVGRTGVSVSGVDLARGIYGDGVWDPTTLCRELITTGEVQLVTFVVNAVFFAGVFFFACDTMVRLRRKSTKPCCQTKLTWEITGLIAQLALFAMLFFTELASEGMKNSGIDHQFMLSIQSWLAVPVPLLGAINTVFVAITWTHVASNARAFRRTTPRSAKRRVYVFVGIMLAWQVFTIIIGITYNLRAAALAGMINAIAIIITYLVGSCKIQAVLDVKMVGSNNSSASTSGEGERSGSGTRATAALRVASKGVKRSAMAWLRERVSSKKGIGTTESGSGKSKRYKHLETIMKAARRVVLCYFLYLVIALTYSQQRHGLARVLLTCILWNVVGWIGIVLLWYYRAAIFSNATRKKSGTGVVESSAGVSNASVVPLAGGGIGESGVSNVMAGGAGAEGAAGAAGAVGPAEQKAAGGFFMGQSAKALPPPEHWTMK